MKKNNFKVVVVLGMHRSGTSIVAGILNKMGINMGNDLVGKKPSNPFGHFEDKSFININRAILSKAYGSWDNPPNEEDILAQAKPFGKEIKELIGKKDSLNDIWGWKDPRTCLTIKLYTPYLINPYFIFCHRKDIEIAESLKRRNNYEIQKSLNIANIYNNRVVNFFQEYKNFRKIDLYYEDFLVNPKQNITKIANFLSLNVNQERIEIINNFIEPKDEIRRISRRMYIFQYLKTGIGKSRRLPLFLYKRIRKIK